tara:strand:+ start:68 stop:925 length:858 start_codon:yes stop_codon:yes gene_type:complete
MHLVGEYLKKNRIKNKYSINDISENLKISYYILQKIENDEFTDELNKTYLVGHVRSYAKFLNLDSDDLAKKFKLQVSYSKKNQIENLPKPLDSNNIFKYSSSISFFSVVTVCVGFYFLFINSNNQKFNYSITPQIDDNLMATIEEFELNADLDKFNKEKKISLNNKVVSEQTNIEDINKYKLKQYNVIASEPSDNEIAKVIEDHKITLRFIEPTWIQLRNNQGDIILSSLMYPKDYYSYYVSDNYNLTTGNAGNIIIKIDDNTAGKLGKKGQVIESFIINSDFEN